MSGMPSLQEQARRLREAEAQGKVLPEVARKIIALADAEKAELEALGMRTAGRGKLIAAIYILGGSLHQLARHFKIKPGTVWSYVRNNVPQEIRQLASKQRDFGRSGQLLSEEEIAEYHRIFIEQKIELFQKNSVRLAATLNTIRPKQVVSDKMEDATDEPY